MKPFRTGALAVLGVLCIALSACTDSNITAVKEASLPRSDFTFGEALDSPKGLLATGAPVGWWMWIARTLPADADVGGGLMVAVVQLCIALGSTLGGILFDSSGSQSTFVFSAALLAIGAFIVFLTARADGTASK